VTAGRILVVEDDAALSRILCDILRAERYDCRAVESAEDALAALASPPAPDLILLDIMLPGMDGFQFLRRLEADGRGGRVPVIVVSTLGDARNRAQARGLGAVDFIEKPFEPADLPRRVARAMARPLDDDGVSGSRRAEG
jgi:DNA-binding response OmpR family regulator